MKNMQTTRLENVLENHSKKYPNSIYSYELEKVLTLSRIADAFADATRNGSFIRVRRV